MLALTGCGTTPAPAAAPAPRQVVRVAAASDLKFALDEFAARLAADAPDLEIKPTYGSSGNFHTQLQQQAPFDLYLSADVGYPRDLVKRGVGTEKDLFVYAVGHLVVWVSNASPLSFERDGLRALRRANRIAIANPRHAPYGRAAEAAMRRAGIWDDVAPRLVLGDNIAQTAQFVQSGSADAGLIARSIAAAGPMKEAGRAWDVPPDTYPTLLQGGLILPWATSPQSAARVRDALLGALGRAVLPAFGFDTPDSARSAADAN